VYGQILSLRDIVLFSQSNRKHQNPIKIKVEFDAAVAKKQKSKPNLEQKKEGIDP